MADRDVIRCPWCRLNQFVTQNGLCRACHNRLGAKVTKKVAVQTTEPVTEWLSLPLRTRLAEMLRSFRMLRRMSQKQAADKMGVARPYISKCELGTYEPTIRNLLRLCSVYRTSPAEFMQEVEKR